jgi:hypothetical protein
MKIFRIILFVGLIGSTLFYAGCSQTRFYQDYTPDWEKKSAVEIKKINQRMLAEDVVSFSNYYSFVGYDEQGWIAFAIDNNRRRTDGEYEIEHATFYYETGEGFVDIPGYGSYTPIKQEIETIPDSEYFRFSKENGTTIIQSLKTNLELRFGSMSSVFEAESNRSFFSYGVAPAELRRNGRVLKGRIIFEKFNITDFRFSLTNWELMSNFITNRKFHGIYLMTEDYEDIYLRGTNFKASWAKTPEAFGFASEKGRVALLDKVKIEAKKHKQAKGLYRWPTQWQVSWGENDMSKLTINEVESKVFSSWFIGGFVMVYVTGEVTLKSGETKKVSGFAELILP